MPSKEAFFAEHYAYAREAGLSDVQARLAVSQAAVETGWGTEGVAVKGNNYFGMKVGDDWAGKSINLPTREETKKGKSYTVKADFRQYESPVDAYRDWGTKMAKNWPGVMKAKNFDQAVDALNHGTKGVYATGSKYGASLKSVNRDLEKSGIAKDTARVTPAGLGSMGRQSPFEPGPNAGLGGGLLGKYRSDVPARTVQTSRVPAEAAPIGPMNAKDPLAKEINSLHPAFQARAREFMTESKKRGLNLSIVPDAYRSPAEQAGLYAQGRTKPGNIVTKAPPGDSFHNYGLGFDVVPDNLRGTKNWSPDDPQWGQIDSLAKELGFGRIDWDKPHIQPAGIKSAGSLKGLPTFDQAGNSYPSLDETSLEHVAQPHAGLARSMAGTGLLGLDGRLADTSSVVAGAGLRQPDSAYAAPMGQVDRSALADVPGLGTVPTREVPTTDIGRRSLMMGEDLTSPLTGLGFPGMSVPTDTASPRTMAKSLKGIAGVVADNPTGGLISDTLGITPGELTDKENRVAAVTSPGAQGFSLEHAVAGALGLGGPESLAPDRPMPSGPVGLAAPAPAAPQGLGATELAGLQAMQDKREYERPALSNLLSPQAMAPALSAPTAVQNRPITQTIAPSTAQTATTTIAAPEQTAQNTFPDAPAEPTDSLFGPKSKAALTGLLTAGPIGGLLGYAASALGGGLGSLGGGPAGMASAGESFNAGTGLGGMMQGINGPRGATGYSRSNPGTFSVSRGLGLGSDLTNQYGARTTYGPSGDIRANKDTNWSGVLGGIFGGSSKKSDSGKGKGGLGKYSGKGLY